MTKLKSSRQFGMEYTKILGIFLYVGFDSCNLPTI